MVLYCVIADGIISLAPRSGVSNIDLQLIRKPLEMIFGGYISITVKLLHPRDDLVPFEVVEYLDCGEASPGRPSFPRVPPCDADGVNHHRFFVCLAHQLVRGCLQPLIRYIVFILSGLF